MVSFHLVLPGMHTLEHDFISEQKLKTHVQKETSQFLSLPSPAGGGGGGGIVVKYFLTTRL